MAQWYTISGSILSLGVSVEMHKNLGRSNPSPKELGIPGADFSGTICTTPGPWIYVRFRLAQLAFSGSDLPKLILQATGFVEGKKPLWQRFQNISEKQEDVWRLGKGDNLILVDKEGGVRVLAYGASKLYEPTVEQVYAHFLKQEGQVTGRASSEVSFENLTILEDTHPRLAPLIDGDALENLKTAWEETCRSMQKMVR